MSAVGEQLAPPAAPPSAPAGPTSPPPGPGGAAAGPARRPGRAGRWRRRWHRVAIPFAVLLMLVGVTWLARSLEEPDLGEASTLSPTGTGPDGSSRLAELLTERGIRIEPVSNFEEAEAAVRRGGDAVVFIPKSTLFGGLFAGSAVYQAEADHRIVWVAPSRADLAVSALPIRTDDPRWASAAREPDCRVPEALAAGRASALRGRYLVANEFQICYDGGLVHTEVSDSDVFVIGSTDPFRNRRIGEYGNERLALELLATHDRVIWAGALPFEADIELPDIDAPERGERSRYRSCGYACMFEGYPQQVLAGLGLAALLAVLLALVRARRLGPPVSEPLPVVVPAAEAVAGRGRLYQRSRGRGVALSALRAAALSRLIRALGLPPAPPPDPETIVQAVAARCGLPPEQVRHTLYGPEPETDEDLTTAVAALDWLVAAVTHGFPHHRQGDAP